MSAKRRFARGKARYRAQPTALVLCEDTKSCRTYLEDVRAYFRVNIEIAHCGYTDPKNILLEAQRRESKFDRIFCAIDRDEHHNYEEAAAIARRSKKIKVIASHPCFEYWLLLHFILTTKAYVRAGQRSPADCLIDDLRKQPGMSTYAKGQAKDLFEQLRGRFTAARQRAAATLEDAVQRKTWNPSTQLHELIEYIEGLSSPQPIG